MLPSAPGGPRVAETAYLDVRLAPWRPRPRVMDPDTLRDGIDPFVGADDLGGVLVGLVLWVLVVVTAPLLVLVIAALLLSVELPVAVAIGLLYLVARFAGVVPWTVLVIDPEAGTERRERYRTLWGAVSRVRAVNGGGRTEVRWAWA